MATAKKSDDKKNKTSAKTAEKKVATKVEGAAGDRIAALEKRVADIEEKLVTCPFSGKKFRMPTKSELVDRIREKPVESVIVAIVLGAIIAAIIS